MATKKNVENKATNNQSKEDDILYKNLDKYFGFEKFKGPQEEIIQSLLSGKAYLCLKKLTES
jgi:superfamily II DNA helicase RecQ